MRSFRNRGLRQLACLSVSLVAALSMASAADEEWIELTGKNGLAAWKTPTGEWQIAGDAIIDPKNPRLLTAEPGTGVIVNGPTGRTSNLFSKQSFGAIEAHFEFLVPHGSNSGVKFEGLYEVQIADSYGVKTPTASHSGGIYPRAELTPVYHHIDKGYPPRTNAARPPGEWQSLDVTFEPPQFDTKGNKTADARFVKVVLNGQLVQEDLAVPTPTGHAWHDREVPSGPLLLQADHGPVAFRNIRVRPRPAR